MRDIRRQKPEKRHRTLRFFCFSSALRLVQGSLLVGFFRWHQVSLSLAFGCTCGWFFKPTIWRSRLCNRWNPQGLGKKKPFRGLRVGFRQSVTTVLPCTALLAPQRRGTSLWSQRRLRLTELLVNCGHLSRCWPCRCSGIRPQSRTSTSSSALQRPFGFPLRY